MSNDNQEVWFRAVPKDQPFTPNQRTGLVDYVMRLLKYDGIRVPLDAFVGKTDSELRRADDWASRYANLGDRNNLPRWLFEAMGETGAEFARNVVE